MNYILKRQHLKFLGLNENIIKRRKGKELSYVERGSDVTILRSLRASGRHIATGEAGQKKVRLRVFLNGYIGKSTSQWLRDVAQKWASCP